MIEAVIHYVCRPHGDIWKIMRNDRLICYLNDAERAEHLLLSYAENARAAGKAVHVQVHDHLGRIVLEKQFATPAALSDP